MYAKLKEDPVWVLRTHRNDRGRFFYRSLLTKDGTQVKMFLTDTRWGARREARRFIRKAMKPTSWTYEIKP